MKKCLFLLALSICSYFGTQAQGLVSITYTLKGTVVEDAQYNDKLAGATVNLEGTYFTTSSDAKGNFIFKNIPPNTYVARISLIGYETLRIGVDLERDNAQLTFKLKPSSLVQDEVVVNANRIRDNAASNVSNIGKEELEKMNYGQDLPYMLNNTPGVVVGSYNGNGVGYSNITIRGTDNTRTNVTINGIPLNDAESQGSYTVNLPDLVSSVDNIQVQRGVGTSTNGAGAFGASVNIQTTKLNKEPYAELSNAISPNKGADINLKFKKKGKKVLDQGFTGFGTLKNTVSLGTGLLKDHWVFDGRFSRVNTEGYIDRGSAKLTSYFLSGGYYGNKLLVRFNQFSGQEKTYLVFGGVPEAKLRGDQAGLLNHYYNNKGYLYMDAADSTNLFNSNARTFNSNTYADETDNYKQDHYQLLGNYQLSRYINFNLGLHYTKGAGYYEQFKKDEGFAKYGLMPLIYGSDTINRTDLIRRRWLDNDFYGFTYSGTYYSKEALTLTIGGSYTIYQGRHYGEIYWARFASQSNIRDHYYDAKAKKTDFNFYIKPTLRIGKRIETFAELQARSIGYDGTGDDNNKKNVDFHDGLLFINPKAGISYMLNARNKFFGYIGVANKEPNRDDYRNLAPAKKPNPEQLTDMEVGYGRKDRFYTLDLTLYNMLYKDQLVLTGQVNDVYEPLRVNVSNSYRRGIELATTVRLNEKIKIGANAAYSQNKIKQFEEKINQYDMNTYAPAGVATTVYKLTDISYSPSLVTGGLIEVEPISNGYIGLTSKYVGKQYLDNTANESRKLDGYWVNDLRLAYTLKTEVVKSITFSLMLNNFLNALYQNGGYTYASQYVDPNNTAAPGTTVRENFYYPQAVRNIMFGLSAKF